MEVQIRLSALSGYIPKHWSKNMLNALRQDIRQKALHAWHNRKEGETSVRFLQVMPAKSGLHFRFLTVTRKDGHTLLVR